MPLDEPIWTPVTEKGMRYWNWIKEARNKPKPEKVMKASQDAIKLIVYYETGGKPEKFLNAYWDDLGKVWTIGIGSTLHLDGTPVKEGDKISLEQAYAMVDRHLEKEVYPVLNKLVNTVQNRYDAFVDFCYNLGVHRLKGSTLLDFHNKKKPASEITRAFMMWNKAGGKVQPGIIKRRMSEAELYNTGNLVFYEYDKKTDKYYKVKGV